MTVNRKLVLARSYCRSAYRDLIGVPGLAASDSRFDLLFIVDQLSKVTNQLDLGQSYNIKLK